MSDETKPPPNLGPDLLFDAAVDRCEDQKIRTRAVERELRKTVNRLEHEKVATIFQLEVYAFNCSDKRHEKDGPHPMHVDYVGGVVRFDVPGSLQATIVALEHALGELRKRVQ